MKKILKRVIAVVICALMVIPCFSVTTSAEAFSYRSAANGASDAYKGSRYYNNLMQIQLTGDGVTDLLAVALSQVGYLEGTSTAGFSGTQGGGGNYTEYNYNMGQVGGWAYAWCASFVSWSLLQSRCTDQNTQGAWCRNHMGDINYIWREVGCYKWYNQLKNFGYGHADDGNYIPKSGDLIFFESSEHIGIVRYSKNGKVYTIEGNTTGGEGVASDGGGVHCKNYTIGSSAIRGYGSLPLKSNPNASKVDYSGENPTTGLWISSTNKYLYYSSSLSGDHDTIPKGTMFEVINVISKGCLEVKYNGKTGYVSTQAGGGDPVYQVTSTAPASSNPNNNNDNNGSATEKPTEKPTEKETVKVTPNKYAINSEIKNVKEHVGSGISKYVIDGKKTKEAESYVVESGQSFGIEGFAGFSVFIKEFGYYYDGNSENITWGFNPTDPTSDAKKKAGEKARMFNIEADTSSLSGGDHTITYVVKFLNNKTCELTTLNLNINGEGSGNGSGTGEATDGCGSSIAFVSLIPVAAIFGVAIIKKKED